MGERTNGATLVKLPDHFDRADAAELVKWLRGAASSIEDSGVQANDTFRTLVRQVVSEVNAAQRAKDIVDTTEVQEAPRTHGVFDGVEPPAGWVMDPTTLRYVPPASSKDVEGLQLRVTALERMFQGAYEGVKSDVRARLDAMATQTPPPAPPDPKPHNPHEIPSGWEQLHHLKRQQDAQRARGKDGDQQSA